MFVSRKLIFTVAIAACSRAPAAGVGTPAPAGAPYIAADVHFMSGMITHHAQAVLIGGWAVDTIHGGGPAVRRLAERIIVSQQDEIAFLERWLRERHETRMNHAMLMPGMLNSEQLAQLARARGAEFDRLFLSFMIQHHRGAITMVDQLLGAPGAAQDGLVFRFAADVHADQTAEIDRMQRLLAALTFGGKTP